FKHGVPDVNNCRASTRSCAVNGCNCSLIYGSCWPDIAMKNRTRICNSFGEKLNVGIRKCRYGRTPFRSNPGCGSSFPVWLFAAGLALACGELVACGLGDGNAAICCACSGVFSPLNDGSCRNRNSQDGSTRAPSLVSRGGKRSLPSGVW